MIRLALISVFVVTGCGAMMGTPAGIQLPPEDQYAPDKAAQAYDETCGGYGFSLKRETASANARYRPEALSRTESKAVPCEKIDALSTEVDPAYEAGVIEAVGEEAYRNDVIVPNGHTANYETVSFVHYSKATRIARSGCSREDKKLVCEASGSQTVKTHNMLVYLTERAKIRKDAGEAAECQQISKYAVQEAQAFDRKVKLLRETGNWGEGYTYEIAGGDELSEDEILGRIDAMESDAPSWCQ